MSKILFLIVFSLQNLILHIRADKLIEGQDLGISGIDYDENEMKLKQLCMKNETMLKALRSLLAKAVAKGDSKNSLNYFKCAVSNSMVDLEVYKASGSKWLYKNEPEPSSPTTNNGKWIPRDIEKDIAIYDAWVPYYDALSIPIRDSIANPPSTFRPDQLEKLKAEISKISKNWYLIVTCPHEDRCPSYVNNLQKYLKAVQLHNPNKYATEEEIYHRFAIHMARSFRMMRVLHNKVLSFMDKFAKGNLKPLSDLLFKCVPSFYISGEQLFFLNALRSARDPDGEPLQYYSIKNKFVNNEQWTILPFDNSSRCPFDDLRKISTTLIPMLSTPDPIKS